MTTLDFTKYRKGFEINGFSADFIKKKINSYQACVDNLSKVEYDTFLKFGGLDQYEEIKCCKLTNQWRVMSKYKVLSSLLPLVTVDKYVFKSLQDVQ